MVGGETGEGGAWCQEGPEGVRADGVFTRGPKARRVGEQRAKKGLGEWMEASGTGIFATEVLQFRQAEKTPFPKKDGGLWNADPELIHRGLGCSQMQGGGGGA